MSPDLVVIGQVTRPHGVRGEVKVLPFTESPASFQHFDRVYTRRPGRDPEVLGIVEARPHKRLVLLKFKGVHTREEAEDLAGAEILVERNWLPQLEEDEYYWTDLIGLEVLDGEGHGLGTVKNIFTNGVDDILVIVRDGREILLPFRGEIIDEVDLPNGRILANPPLGLLDD
jgi:16S rRNA processing protein RimM